VHPVCLSFDVEDWYHPELVRGRVAPGDARSIVEAGSAAILDLLRVRRARATFFVLGDVAARHPALVRRMAAEGHEIACHGMTHRPLWQLTPESFRRELRDFRAALRGALGEDPAVGFRAPTFSLDRATAWALPVLREEGFTYDSSVFPMRVRLYGVPGAPLGIYRPAADDLARDDPRGPIVEFPVAVRALGLLRLPVAGGFYLRALPFGLLASAIDAIRRRRPAALYLHPWECVPSLPRVALPPADALVTYLNLGSVLRKLERIVDRFASVPMREALERLGHLTPAAPA
jgi:peptidoglycan-N-acetylglucosamine deacetylase